MGDQGNLAEAPFDQLPIMSDFFPGLEGLDEMWDPDWAAFMQPDRCSHTQATLPPVVHEPHAWPQAILPSHVYHTLPETQLGPGSTPSNTLVQHYPDHGHAQTIEAGLVAVPMSDTSDIPDLSVAQHKCEVSNCNKVYKRRSDMLRHLKKHSETKLDCLVSTCKLRGRRGNTRVEKFVKHLRRGHPEVHSWTCTLPYCSKELPSFGLLAAHMRCHTQGVNEDWESIQVRKHIIHAFSVGQAHCPIKRCDKKLLPQHLLSDHPDPTARQAAADSLGILGFDWQTGSLICPVCAETFSSSTNEWTRNSSLSSLREHIAEKHISADWEQLRAVTNSTNRYLTASADKVCSKCNARNDWWTKGGEEHRRECIRSLFRESTEACRFREHILSIDPSFINHPVFDDIRPGVSEGREESA